MTFYNLLETLQPLTKLRVEFRNNLELTVAFKRELYRATELLDLSDKGLLGKRVEDAKLLSLRINNNVLEVALNV